MTERPPTAAPSVALLLIGDELLSGKVRDTNGPFVVDTLADVGGRLSEIRVVGDAIEDIAEATRALKGRYDWLVTSGGIGPTHDDRTMEAIATAFGVGVYREATLVARIEEVFAADPDRARVWSRMADVPDGSTFIPAEGSVWPIFRRDNVFILPGVPRSFEVQFAWIADTFSGTPKRRCVLYVRVDEGGIAEPLDEAVERFPAVTFGSYPVRDNDDYRTRLTLESLDPVAVDEARDWLKTALPDQSVVAVHEGERVLKG